VEGNFRKNVLPGLDFCRGKFNSLIERGETSKISLGGRDPTSELGTGNYNARRQTIEEQMGPVRKALGRSAGVLRTMIIIPSK